MQVYCYFKNPLLSELISSFLEGNIGVKPLILSSSDEFIHHSKNASDRAICVCECEKSESLLVEESLNLSNLKRYYISNEMIQGLNVFPLSEFGDLLQHIESNFESNKEEDDIEEDYISMPIHLFKHFNTLPCDIFIKVEKDGVRKFIKRIPADESFERDLIDSYLSKGVKELYFSKDFKRDFSKLLFTNLVFKLRQDSSSEKEYSTSQEEVFYSLKELVNNLGIQKHIVNVCEAAIQSIEKEMNKLHGPWKSALYKLLQGSEQSYHLRFVRLTCLFITQFLELKNWPAKDQVAKKLYYASFFCDMNIDDEKLLRIREFKDLESLTDFDKKRVLLHAKKNAESVKNYPGISEDIIQLILRHHGPKTGIGFEIDSNDKLPELVKVFIICQEMAFTSLTHPEFTIEENLQVIKEKFKETQLQKVVDSFAIFFEDSLISETI